MAEGVEKPDPTPITEDAIDLKAIAPKDAHLLRAKFTKEEQDYLESLNDDATRDLQISFYKGLVAKYTANKPEQKVAVKKTGETQREKKRLEEEKHDPPKHSRSKSVSNNNNTKKVDFATEEYKRWEREMKAERAAKEKAEKEKQAKSGTKKDDLDDWIITWDEEDKEKERKEKERIQKERQEKEKAKEKYEKERLQRQQERQKRREQKKKEKEQRKHKKKEEEKKPVTSTWGAAKDFAAKTVKKKRAQ